MHSIHSLEEEYQMALRAEEKINNLSGRVRLLR